MPSQFWSATVGMATPLWYPQRYNLDGKLDGIAPTTDFTAISVHDIFRQASLELGISGSELRTLPTGQPRSFKDKKEEDINVCTWYMISYISYAYNEHMHESYEFLWLCVPCVNIAKISIVTHFEDKKEEDINNWIWHVISCMSYEFLWLYISCVNVAKISIVTRFEDKKEEDINPVNFLRYYPNCLS